MRSTGSIKSNPLQAYEKEYWRLSAYKKRHQIFFISNLGFGVELGLLNSETEIGTGIA